MLPYLTYFAKFSTMWTNYYQLLSSPTNCTLNYIFFLGRLRREINNHQKQDFRPFFGVT